VANATSAIRPTLDAFLAFEASAGGPAGGHAL
jgi:hypothetical protein